VDHELDVGSLLARSRRSTTRRAEGAVFRIDKDEMAADIGRIRDNLAKLFYARVDERQRALVVDLQAPAFDDVRQRLKDEKESVLDEIRSRCWGKYLLRKIIGSCLACRGQVKQRPSRRQSRSLSSEGRPCSSQVIPIRRLILSLLRCTRSTLKSCGL